MTNVEIETTVCTIEAVFPPIDNEESVEAVKEPLRGNCDLLEIDDELVGSETGSVDNEKPGGRIKKLVGMDIDPVNTVSTIPAVTGMLVVLCIVPEGMFDMLNSTPLLIVSSCPLVGTEALPERVAEKPAKPTSEAFTNAPPETSPDDSLKPLLGALLLSITGTASPGRPG